MVEFAVRSPGSTGGAATGVSWRQLDLVLVATAVALGVVGSVMVTSATVAAQRAAGENPYHYLERQLLFLLLGVVLMGLATVVDYRRLVHAAPTIYVGTIVVLGALLVAPPAVAPTIKGIKAWFRLGPFQLQPAELAKITVIVTLAAYGAAQRQLLDGKRVATMLGLTAAPMALIFLQPDLGTALVFGAIAFVMIWVAGATAPHLLGIALAGAGAAVIAVRVGVLERYQLERLWSFVDSSRALSGAGYNVAQSKIAIGSGGFTGSGLFRGAQTESGFVPERHTDFIFSVVGEQLGFVGGTLLILGFCVLGWRILRNAALARDLAGSLLCVGVFAMFAFQVFQNIGMTMQLMPVTGIPLPFVSHGGSSLWASYLGVGIVLNVHAHRFR